MNSLVVSSKRIQIYERKFAEVNKSLPEHAVLKLAVHNENLGSCDLRDYFTDNFKNDLLIASSHGAIIAPSLRAMVQ